MKFRLFLNNYGWQFNDSFRVTLIVLKYTYSVSKLKKA